MPVRVQALNGEDEHEVITVEDFLKFRKAVIRKLKYLEGLIDDAFVKINENDDRLTQNVDEAIDQARRAGRAVRRVKRTLDEHDHEEEDG
jgi:hypothetical protein